MEVAEEQAVMEFVSDSEVGGQGRGWQNATVQKEKAEAVGRQLECCRDEVRCRELMAGAHPKVKVALRNLKVLLEQERRA